MKTPNKAMLIQTNERLKKEIEFFRVKADRKEKEAEKACLLYSRLVGHFGDKFSEDKYYEYTRERGHFTFIPRGPAYVLRTLINLRSRIFIADASKPRFLDAGCGIGNIVTLAHITGYEAYGIEFDDGIYKTAKDFVKMFRVPDGRIMQEDIGTFGFYSGYDVIYAYCPMSNTKKQADFETRVIENAKPGAYLAGLNICCRLTWDGGKDKKLLNKLEVVNFGAGVNHEFLDVCRRK